MITAKDLRQKYLDFFSAKGHKIIPSASLIPENDPSVLFTTAGMHPLVPYLLGEKHPSGNRLADVQKCVRTGDIDEVGDTTHLTFFEMLGNWSLGDPASSDGIGEASYFKKDSINFSFEFLTDKKWLGLDIKNLAITVFEGDETSARDEESVEIWHRAGMPKERIAYLGKEDNWWPAGGKNPGPQGPDTEIFYWTGKENAPKVFDPKDSRWIEIWNNVFMQFNRTADGKYEPLAQKNVDTGMGMERTLVALNNLFDVYQIDTLLPLIKKIEKLSGKIYEDSDEIKKSMRIVADHLRTAVMIIGDNHGVAPSNTDQGYIVRRLIRRAVRHGKNLGMENNFCVELAKTVIEIFKDIYPEVKKNENFVLTEIEKEENKFSKTLENGLREFRKMSVDKIISGKEAFDLFQSYGFPLEMTIELAKEQGAQVNIKEFEEELKKHQDLSRVGAEQKFKGGLADTGEESKKLHTATHLLHSALRQVLGEQVEQRGSNITAERLRFDFSYPEKMTSEQVQQTQDLVNSAIEQKLPIDCEEMTVPQAKGKGAIGLFGDKYGDKVKVYTMGADSKPFSREICGGPHAQNTGDLGRFEIVKEEASSAGVRRIKAVLKK